MISLPIKFAIWLFYNNFNQWNNTKPMLYLHKQLSMLVPLEDYQQKKNQNFNDASPEWN